MSLQDVKNECMEEDVEQTKYCAENIETTAGSLEATLALQTSKLCDIEIFTSLIQF